jgi:hypothetical protein
MFVMETPGLFAPGLAWEVELENRIHRTVQCLDPASQHVFRYLQVNPSSPFTHTETFCFNRSSFDMKIWGFYPLTSRFNSFSTPNADNLSPTSETGDLFTLVAYKPIVKGQEITFCYNKPLLANKTKAKRREALWNPFRGPAPANDVFWIHSLNT